jgi:hypothetical protein
MSRRAAARAAADDPGAEWIVCGGRLREVRAEAVRCPVARRTVAVTRCLACRRLVDLSDERDRGAPCATLPDLS